MKWEMEIEEVEAVLEKIWDLHDKLSDAIHAISRSHFLNSIKTLKKYDEALFSRNFEKKKIRNDGEDERNGFVFVKDFRADDEAAISEAKSLNAIRTALENLEDQLEFLNTVQSQQRAERDAAIARLEQSRIILAMRLAEHHGKKYKVIEEALAFVGDVQDEGRFVSPENLLESPKSRSGDNLEGAEGKKSNVMMQILVSSFTFAKKSLKLERMGGVVGNAALFAVSMLALLQVHQAVFGNNFIAEVRHMQEDSFYRKKREKNISELEGYPPCVKHLDVLLARG
ncbi:PREDICTED: plastid division protein PDV1 [Nelumbo nucifera]|uniref:Plastid division protein PDV1 n=2 Tax=Nelumbo nucifera TaxID=4432 RepID=A0A1U7ZF75_NELNU|nr:PREDICTED: plastid division protein PDV1 [Nelumbo nucifera]DAD43286.1 TPA_asm: hypothetical protein HUJ06_001516 [Nelumbo nucifera]